MLTRKSRVAQNTRWLLGLEFRTQLSINFATLSIPIQLPLVARVPFRLQVDGWAPHTIEVEIILYSSIKSKVLQEKRNFILRNYVLQLDLN